MEQYDEMDENRTTERILHKMTDPEEIEKRKQKKQEEEMNEEQKKRFSL